jgi:hypothetical protein
VARLEVSGQSAHCSPWSSSRAGPAMGDSFIDQRSTVIAVGSRNYRRYMGRNYRQGYMGRDYHVTGEHEAEAKAAERAKKPTRIGLFVLRLLGERGRAQHAEVSRATARPSYRHRK